MWTSKLRLLVLTYPEWPNCSYYCLFLNVANADIFNQQFIEFVISFKSVYLYELVLCKSVSRYLMLLLPYTKGVRFYFRIALTLKVYFIVISVVYVYYFHCVKKMFLVRKRDLSWHSLLIISSLSLYFVLFCLLINSSLLLAVAFPLEK